jgi:hypothetical protein
MSRQTIDQAIQQGLREGREELATRPKATEDKSQTAINNLGKSFNAASGALEGLTAPLTTARLEVSI